jgi:transmembrane sensor
MEKKNLKKEILFKLILGNIDENEAKKIVESDPVSSMFYHQWNSKGEQEFKNKPGFDLIFEKIKRSIQPDASVNTEFYIQQIEELKKRNKTLSTRFRYGLSIAAGFLLILISAALLLFILNKDERTVTESIAPMGQKSQIILADNTKVFLNSGTVLRYDNQFGKSNRKIELTGEAFFEVTENKLPFTIYTNDLEIKVVGTKFNVMAYPDEPNVETTVTEGKVNVRDLNSEKSVLITANQTALFVKEKRDLTIASVASVNSISWRENLLYFDNENFVNVVKKLERWYNVSIKLVGKDSVDDRFTFTIKNESLREVLDLIKHTTPLNYRFDGDDVTITYKNKKNATK